MLVIIMVKLIHSYCKKFEALRGSPFRQLRRKIVMMLAKGHLWERNQILKRLKSLEKLLLRTYKNHTALDNGHVSIYKYNKTLIIHVDLYHAVKSLVSLFAYCICIGASAVSSIRRDQMTIFVTHQLSVMSQNRREDPPPPEKGVFGRRSLCKFCHKSLHLILSCTKLRHSSSFSIQNNRLKGFLV